jgi:hypothetical protein
MTSYLATDLDSAREKSSSGIYVKDAAGSNDVAPISNPRVSVYMLLVCFFPYFFLWA